MWRRRKRVAVCRLVCTGRTGSIRTDSGPGGTRIRRMPPTFMPYRASSNAGITRPSPSLKRKKPSSLLSKLPPFDRFLAWMMRPKYPTV